jgi:hypothetical protein
MGRANFVIIALKKKERRLIRMLEEIRVAAADLANEVDPIPGGRSADRSRGELVDRVRGLLTEPLEAPQEARELAGEAIA